MHEYNPVPDDLTRPRVPATLREKEAHLASILASLGHVAIAYSGGTDSAYLLSISIDALGRDHVLAVTADSPLTPRAELDAARMLAKDLDVVHIIAPADDLANENIVANEPNRCYHCKLARFASLARVAQAQGFAHLLHGENLDDSEDYRPGSKAAKELGVRAPLREANLAKTDIRVLSRARGLVTWNRPANSCLASRLPYGTRLTAEALHRVEAAETALQRLWAIPQLRVRDHLPVARIEVDPNDFQRVVHEEHRRPAVEQLRTLGYHYVTLDLSGYRMGSLNDDLELKDRR